MPDSRSNYKHRQVCWRFEKERTPRGSRRVVVVDDARYTVGYGDPGRAADGEFNNCLIDSLRQCVGIISDRKAVRHALIEEFGSADGRAKVTDTSESCLETSMFPFD